MLFMRFSTIPSLDYSVDHHRRPPVPSSASSNTVSPAASTVKMRSPPVSGGGDGVATGPHSSPVALFHSAYLAPSLVVAHTPRSPLTREDTKGLACASSASTPKASPMLQ